MTASFSRIFPISAHVTSKKNVVIQNGFRRISLLTRTMVDTSRKRPANGNSLESNANAPKKFKNWTKKEKKSKNKDPNWPECDKDDVISKEVNELLATLTIENATTITTPIGFKEEIDVVINKFSATGPGLALHEPSRSVLVVPFSTPGDLVTVRPFKYFDSKSYWLSDFVKVKQPSEIRDDKLVQCEYFSKCSGCQFQMIPYKNQLSHKKSIVENAYRWFSGIDSAHIPTVQSTMGSPLQYGYRTKLTPHFDAPPGAMSARKKGQKLTWDKIPPIGFLLQGTRQTIDIEDCPIGTDAIRYGIKKERSKIAGTFEQYSNGVTILLRESTKRVSSDDKSVKECKNSEDFVFEEDGDYVNLKYYINDHKATSVEYIDDFIFKNPANAFFQNNNSILSPFIQYIRQQIGSETCYLVDAYCGSGLFTVTLSSLFKKSIGIDVAADSIEFASKNASNNNLTPEQASFLAADAAQIFETVKFPPDQTLVVIDPPRKGCDRAFLTQLVQFGPKKLVYVSCNVNTQARDVGYLVNGIEGVDGGLGIGKGVYKLESLRGFDFFPQTGHVEGVAILTKA